jgi:predicted amidophosphoribosyltransferase
MYQYGSQYAPGSTRPSYQRGVETVTAPYSYDGMLDLGPEQGTEYVCSECESRYETDRYLCPACGTLTIERRAPSNDA